MHGPRTKEARQIQGVIIGLGLFYLVGWKYFGQHAEPGPPGFDESSEQNPPQDPSGDDFARADPFHSGRPRPNDKGLSFHSRRLLYNLVNCTPPAVEQFPEELFTMTQRRHGALVLHILITLYMFLALAIACDDYFVPSLEKISDALNLQSDVAGATFMAAGSSAPELATAVIGVFIAKDDIGLSAVVGSAVFNIMFVISVCALFAGTVVYLQWWPLVRDCIFYLISIVALTVSIYDEFIQWYEAWALLLLYFLYIILMFFNQRLEKFMVSLCSCCPSNAQGNDRRNRAHCNGKGPQIDGNSRHSEEHDVEAGSSDESIEEYPCKEANGVQVPLLLEEMENGVTKSSKDHYQKEVKEGMEEKKSPFSIPDGCYKKFIWGLSIPLIIIMFFTIPDCRKSKWQRWYVLTFTMSLIWISAFSYLMVWMITIIGFTLNVPDTVMALTFVAAGVSVPDAIASLIVVKEGFGDMAVSNAVGSNVFDILLCLGLPWVLRTSVTQPGVPVQVYSAGLTYASVTLLSTVVFLLIATHLNRWRLTKCYGAILMAIYVITVAFSCLFELNIFGYLHPTTCLSSY